MLSSFSNCNCVFLIPAYVNLNMYTHFPPLPHSYTLITIFICMFCVLFHSRNHLVVFFLLFRKPNWHPCLGAYWCTHNPALMPTLLFYLHLPFSISFFCISKHLNAFASSSIFIQMYHHLHMYMCFDYSVMTPCNLYAPIVKRLSMPAPSDVARYLHTCDLMFKGPYLSNRPCLRFLMRNEPYNYTYTRMHIQWT